MADTSSSEIEFITRSSAAATPSPVKPRRSGRDRRAPRPKDDLAAPATDALRAQNNAANAAKAPRRTAGVAKTTQRRTGVAETRVDELDDRGDDDDDDDEETLTDLRTTTTTASRQASTFKVTLDAFELERAASNPTLNPRASRDTLSPDPVRVASKAKVPSNPTLEVPRTSAPARKSMSRSPAPPSSSTGVTYAPQASTSAPIASSSRAPARPSASTNTAVPRLAPRAKPKRNSSSDEADDFFARAKKPSKPALRVPGRATAAASGTATKKVSRGSSPIAKSGTIRIDSSSEDEYDKMKRGSNTAATGSTAAPPRALDDGSSDDETDTSSVNSGPGHSESDDGAGSDPENLFSSSAVRPKNLNLPAWARGGIARLSGADVERLQKGPGKNRKRKRLDDISADEEEQQSRGIGAAKKTGLSAFDGIGGSLWDQQLAATAAAKAAATAAAAGSGSGKDKSTTILDDYTFDSDDSLEAEFAIYEKPEPHVPLRPPPGSPNKKRAQKTAAGRSEALSTSPVRRGKSREDTNDSRWSRSATDRSPSQPSPRKRNAPLVISSGDEDEATVAARQKARAAFASTDSDEDGESYLDKIRSMVGRSASAEHRSPSAPVSSAAQIQDGEAAAIKNVGEPVTIRLRMVFDPSRNVPDAVKRAYEREDTLTIGTKESFASLFYEVAIRRTIARDDLVITQVRDPGSSKPLTLARQNQVYEFGTPESLGLVTGRDVEMRGYTRHVWSVVKAQEKQQRLKATEGDREGDDDDDDEELNAAAAAAAARRSAGPQRGVIDLDELPSSDGAMTSANPTSEAAADDLDGLFPLTMRGSKTESLSLAVKPTTTMTQLVKAYCKHFKLPHQGVTIEFEGEALEPARTIEDVKEEYDLDGEETFDIMKAA